MTDPSLLPDASHQNSPLHYNSSQLTPRSQFPVSPVNQQLLYPSSTENYLFNEALIQQLGPALVQSFVEGFHATMPIVNFRLFNNRWIDAGKDLRRLPPTTRVLAMMIQALGAPTCSIAEIAGPGCPDASQLLDGVDYSSWGRSRSPMCRAYGEKALSMLEEHRIISIISTESIIILWLALEVLDRKRSRLGFYSDAYRYCRCAT